MPDTNRASGFKELALLHKSGIRDIHTTKPQRFICCAIVLLQAIDELSLLVDCSEQAE